MKPHQRRYSTYSLACLATTLLIGLGNKPAFSFTLNSVPAYNWYHGCGPTAAASVLGYWDLNGFNNLFDAQGNDVYLTLNVQEQISSLAHNQKYDPTPDDPNLPVPPKTSIADWFGTSEDPLEFGSSYLYSAGDAFTEYAQYRGYHFNAWNQSFGEFTWEDLVSEINANRPLMFLVDSDGDGGTDHFVPVLGYEDRGAQGKWYGLYTTWDENETIEWQQFQGMGTPWGIGYATFVQPEISPEPTSSLGILGLGAFGASVLLKRKRR